MSDATADVRVFRALGYCSLGLYCILAVLFWNSFTSTKTRADDVLVFVATVALVVLYFYGLRYVRRCKASLIVAFAVGFGIVGFLSVPFDSADVFFYMAMGWQQ